MPKSSSEMLMPTFLQAADGRQHLVAVFEQRRFGDLDFQPVRREAGLGDQLHDVLGELRIAELHRRDVDGDLQMLRPATRFAQRLLDDAHRQRSDQAGLLGGLDEGFRLQEPAGR